MIYPSEYTNPLDDPNYGIKSREDEFFYRFKNEIPEPSVVFYNVILKLAGVGLREIDFLLVSLFGIFIIELKNVKYKYENNKWQFYKAWNKEWKECIPAFC